LEENKGKEEIKKGREEKGYKVGEKKKREKGWLKKGVMRI